MSLTTKKLCCRKDDRAMRPIHGCAENFRVSLTMPTPTIPNIFHGLLFRSTLNVPTKFKVRNFTCSWDTRSWDNRGYQKDLGSLWIRPLFLFSKTFNGHVFGSTLWMFPQNLKSVALPLPEIIGDTQKIWAVSGYAYASFSPKFLLGFYLDWPCKCIRQIWSQ